MPLLPGADASPGQGFSLTSVLLLVAILVVVWPLMRWLRRRASEGRRERWAREEEQQTRYTEENDPDLRRNHPEE